ncbi:MAG: DNA/RNA nuclease SfsA [Desulfurococcales archaeon]|nr:DNA/RNA nuclease SfsA [Desulfurococcales archaeon]
MERGGSEGLPQEAQAVILKLDPIPCTFTRRLNRFTVEIRLEGSTVRAHLTNTGRLHELLTPGRPCLATRIGGKKLRYRILALMHRGGYALIDTLTQMKSLEEAIAKDLIPWLKGCRVARRNPRVGGSILDYELECSSTKRLVEVKSAVLEGPASESMYPDCPTDRGVRHVMELANRASQGEKPLIIMVAAFPGARCFKPYRQGDPRLYEELAKAIRGGVEVRAIGIYMRPSGEVILYNPNLGLCPDFLKDVKSGA